MKTGRQSALWLAIVLALAAALMRWRHEPRLTVCGIRPGMRQQQVEALLGRGWRNSEDTWAYGKCSAVYRGGKVRLVGGNPMELDGRVLPPETKLSDLVKLFSPYTEVKGGQHRNKGSVTQEAELKVGYLYQGGQRFASVTAAAVPPDGEIRLRVSGWFPERPWWPPTRSGAIFVSSCCWEACGWAFHGWIGAS